MKDYCRLPRISILDPSELLLKNSLAPQRTWSNILEDENKKWGDGRLAWTCPRANVEDGAAALYDVGFGYLGGGAVDLFGARPRGRRVEVGVYGGGLAWRFVI